MDNNDQDLDVTPKLVFDLNLALYLDLVAALEGAGILSYRQMAARLLNVSMNAREDGDSQLSNVLESIAKGFAGQGDGLSIGLLKAAAALRNDEALGDIPLRPDDT